MAIRFISLFAGIGGFDLGLERAGWECAGQVEINPFCRRVLAKHWPNVVRFEDVREITGELIRDRCGDIDAVVGGFPCQDISIAGNGAGLEGKRSGLWTELFRIICELRPRIAVVENVPALLARGMGRVLGDLASIGFDAEWSIVSACSMGAPHTRERLFIIAYPNEVRWRGFRFSNEREHDICSRLDTWKTAPRGQWRDVERWIRSIVETGNGIVSSPESVGMVDGIPNRLDRIGALGNAVVPDVAQWIGERINATI